LKSSKAILAWEQCVSASGEREMTTVGLWTVRKEKEEKKKEKIKKEKEKNTNTRRKSSPFPCLSVP
jgi:hypothetical protein